MLCSADLTQLLIIWCLNPKCLYLILFMVWTHGPSHWQEVEVWWILQMVQEILTAIKAPGPVRESWDYFFLLMMCQAKLAWKWSFWVLQKLSWGGTFMKCACSWHLWLCSAAGSVVSGEWTERSSVAFQEEWTLSIVVWKANVGTGGGSNKHDGLSQC